MGADRRALCWNRISFKIKDLQLLIRNNPDGKKESLIKLKSIEQVKIGKNETYQVKIYENKLDGKEHIALIKTQDKKIVPRVRVISSNIVTSFLSQNKENLSINKTLNYYKKYKNCILIIIRDELVKNNLNNNNN